MMMGPTWGIGNMHYASISCKSAIDSDYLPTLPEFDVRKERKGLTTQLR